MSDTPLPVTINGDHTRLVGRIFLDQHVLDMMPKPISTRNAHRVRRFREGR